MIKGHAVNAISVDVEDWAQSTLDNSRPVSARAVTNTLKMLDIFGDHGIKGTFFVLGKVAEAFPDLVVEIEGRGHEVGSHGYGHLPVMLQSPDEFRRDLARSLELLTPLLKRPVVGYRAPDFSIVESSLWALDIIRQEGLAYDSSVYPIKGRRYGIPGFGRFVASRAGVLEVPLSTFEVLGKRLPAAGGGYFRMFPYAYNSMAIRAINKEGEPAVVYLHPYELDTQEIPSCTGVPLRLRLTQHTGRGGVERKLRRLFNDFSFAPIREVLGI